jgi:hypothetical protein
VRPAHEKAPAAQTTEASTLAIPSPIPHEPKRQAFRIVLKSCPFGIRTALSIEPPSEEFPPREFMTHEEAMTVAEQLRRLHGWSIADRCAHAD